MINFTAKGTGHKRITPEFELAAQVLISVLTDMSYAASFQGG